MTHEKWLNLLKRLHFQLRFETFGNHLLRIEKSCTSTVVKDGEVRMVNNDLGLMNEQKSYYRDAYAKEMTLELERNGVEDAQEIAELFTETDDWDEIENYYYE